MLWLKKKEIPVSNETQFIDVVQTWEVRWTSETGKYPYNRTQPEMEVFLSKQQAEDFADSLRAAFKLVKHTSYDVVVVTKGK